VHDAHGVRRCQRRRHLSRHGQRGGRRHRALHPPAQVALGQSFRPTWDPKGADFALMLGAFYCASLDAPLLAEIERAGVVFARVHDIRGRDVPSLFTLPPVEREQRKASR